MDWIYLDNNATTQPAPEVVEKVAEVHRRLWANPSSVHRFGQMVRQQMELARAHTAELIGAAPREIIFTSGGTESNNLALRGTLNRGGTLITTRVEHSAIREPGQAMEESGVRRILLPVDIAGRVDPGSLDAAIGESAEAGADGPILVSIQWANNETGVLQPMAVLAEVVDRHRQAGRRNLLLHVDATQAVGKISIDAAAIPFHLLTMSAHKFHGPKGVGALYVRRSVRLRAQNLGGPQEREKRGGTENTAGIIGMGVAAQLAAGFLADVPHLERLRGLRDRLETGICQALPGTAINGSRDGRPAARLWNTTNLGFPRIEAEAILVGLSERGVCASAGAACSSGSLEPSPVLLAMGIPEEVAHGSVRFSLGRYTRQEEIERALELVPAVVKRLAQVMPSGA